MTPDRADKFAAGFGDPPPPRLASTRHTIRFLGISAGIAVATFIQAQRALPTQSGSRIPLYLALIAVEILLAWFVAAGVRARGGTFLDLIGKGWRSPFDCVRDAILAIVFVIMLGSSSFVLFYLLGRWRSNTALLLPKTLSESAVWCVVAITAGICEEIVYRGYFQRQLWSLSRSMPVAIVLQAVVFGSGHLYQGGRPAAVTAIYGLAFGLLAAWRKSILPGAIAHSIIDIIGGLAPR